MANPWTSLSVQARVAITITGIMLVAILLALMFGAATRSTAITPSTGRQIRALVHEAQALKNSASTAPDPATEAFKRGKATGLLQAAQKIAGSAPAASKVSGISLQTLRTQLASPSSSAPSAGSEQDW